VAFLFQFIAAKNLITVIVTCNTAGTIELDIGGFSRLAQSCYGLAI